MEQGLFEFLRDNTAIAAIISGRVYGGHLPQDPTYPAVVYQRISTPRERSMGGGSVQSPRMQIDAWATTKAAAKSLADTIAGQLDWITGTMGSDTVLHAQIEDERADYDPTVNAFRYSCDYIIIQVE